ncbi:hypothetical protein D2T81_16705 [Azospirillum brasilense]|nr:hypothetical protein D2T81_16705 [Azospirillum brasilense]
MIHMPQSPYHLPVGLVQTATPVDLSPYAPRHAPTFSGTARFDGPVQAASASVGHGSTGQYDNALILLPTSHPASRRCTIQIDPGWIIGQDSGANGNTDFFLWNRATSRAPFAVGVDDTVAVGGIGNGATTTFQRAANQINGLTFKGAATGGEVGIGASGADTDLNIVYSAKNIGTHRFTGAGTEQFRISPTAGAVNRLNATGAAPGGTPSLSAQGSDANVPVRLSAQGLGSVTLAQGTTPVFIATSYSAAAVNHLVLEARETGSGPVLRMTGPDTNIDLNLRPKGSGTVSFGAFTAAAGAAVAGYIEIKDATGQPRRLAVVN